MDVIVRHRQEGKSTALAEWVLEGKSTKSYPFWTRVILTPNITQANLLRRNFDLDYQQVFSAAEWKQARLGVGPVAVAIDNAEWLLDDLVGQHVSLITMTGNVRT